MSPTAGVQSRARRFVLVKAAVSLVLIGWVITEIVGQGGMAEAVRRSGSLDPLGALAALFLPFLAVSLGVLRFRVLLEAQGVRLPLRWLTETYLVGRFVGAFTPSTVGLDVYRVVAVGRRVGEKARATSAVATEKALGLAGLSVVTLGILPWGGSAFLDATSIALTCSLGAGAAMLLVLLAGNIRLPHARLERALAPFRRGSLDTRTVGSALALGIASHFATAAVFVAIGLAVGTEASFSATLLAGNLIVISTLIPISLGGIGVRESVAVLVLGAFGVPAGEATLIAFLGYLAGQPPALLGGLVAMGPMGAAERASHGPIPNADVSTNPI